jgi:hypothetical protein
MNLTVSGYGFGQGNISATVDGQNCTVISQQQTSFSCLVQPRENVSVSGIPYIGSNGIIRHFINESRWLDWNQMHTYDAEK